MTRVFSPTTCSRQEKTPLRRHLDDAPGGGEPRIFVRVSRQAAVFGQPIACFTLVLSLFSAPVAANDLERQDLPFFLKHGLKYMLRQVPPEIRQFRDLVEDPPLYEAPEVLPNGDIIIRRKRGTAKTDPSAQIDL